MTDAQRPDTSMPCSAGCDCRGDRALPSPGPASSARRHITGAVIRGAVSGVVRGIVEWLYKELSG